MGTVSTLLTEVAGRGGATGTATRVAVRSHTDGGEVTLGPADEEAAAATRTDPETVVVASGNLAMIYLPRHPGRLTRERVDALVPGLIDGLAAHPGIGLVVVDSAAGPLAIGARLPQPAGRTGRRRRPAGPVRPAGASGPAAPPGDGPRW